MASTISDMMALPIMARLLKNNCVVYGSIVREAVAGTPMAKYCEGNDAAIVGWTETKYQGLLERDLHDFIHNEGEANESVTYHQKRYTLYRDRCINEQCADVHYNSPTLTLILTFVTSYRMLAPCVATKVDLDINLLQVDRDGLSLRYIPRDYIHVPTPFADIFRRARQREFHVINTGNETTAYIEWLHRRVCAFKERGWTHANTKLQLDGVRDEDCVICHETMRTGDNVLLRCSHAFHALCWKQHVEASGRLSSSSRDVLMRRAKPPATKCPVCRHSFMPWEIQLDDE